MLALITHTPHIARRDFFMFEHFEIQTAWSHAHCLKLEKKFLKKSKPTSANEPVFFFCLLYEKEYGKTVLMNKRFKQRQSFTVQTVT